MAITSLGRGLFFWSRSEQKWESTGQDITYHNKDKLVWTLPIDSITFVTINCGAHLTQWLSLIAVGKHRSIPLLPKLREKMQAIAAATA